MIRNSERGSALIMLFIGLALFGLISFTFLQGSRSNVELIKDVQADAQTTQFQGCANSIDAAVKRLEARGCAQLISHEQDGSNPNTGAPTNGSCSVFHSNGGGLKPCTVNSGGGGGPAPPDDTCLASLTAGTGCTGADGLVAVYAGVSGGNRIYAAPADLASTTWNNGSGTMPNIAGATSNSNGVANTDAILATGSGSPYRAAANCRALGAKWYLPAPGELSTLYSVRNTGDFSGTFTTSSGGGSRYWSSRQVASDEARSVRLQDGSTDDRDKDESLRVRCIRQE